MIQTGEDCDTPNIKSIEVAGISAQLSRMTLNMNGLSSLTERQRHSERIKE